MNEEQRIKTFQVVVIISSSLLILLLIGAWFISGPGQEWRRVQRDYKIVQDALIDTITDMHSYGMIRGIQQLEIVELNRVDRCATCHLGFDNPILGKADQPFRTHSGDFLRDHPADEYACTICHGGQGRALTSKEAHGIDQATHWSHPLLSQPYIQSACGQCHLTIFSDNERFSGIDVFQKGQDIFNREGCLGCHKARGVGGYLGPDLTEQGEKTSHEYSFQNITSEPTIANWLKEHFRDPEMVSPGSQMLKLNLPEEDLVALTTFILGLSKPDINFKYFSIETLKEFKGERENLDPKMIFSMACSACHGKEGKGKSYEEYHTGVPGILREDFLRVASKEYINFTLYKGRSQRQMASWMPSYSGLRKTELEDLIKNMFPDKNNIDHLYNTTLFTNADASAGEKIFEENCVMCHGKEGKGDIAIAVNSPDFLRNADNQFIYNTLLEGRKNATMPSWQNMELSDMYDVMKYIRSWKAYFPQSISTRFLGTDMEAGKIKYHFMCSRCHGEHGEGQTGPAIINEDFMKIATDEFLYSTIAYGRNHSAMFGWSTDVYNTERLSKADIGNIISFIRNESSKKPDYIYAGRNPGDKNKGQILYKNYCAKCHGNNGEGVKAPALNNQELLNAASNGYLLATISLGRSGTAMPAWGIASEDNPGLMGNERQDILAWIRSWQRIMISY